MNYPYKIPELPYGYGGLEPYIDAATMEIHLTKHHQTYVNKLNDVLAKYPSLQEQPLEDLMRNLNTLEMPDADKTALKNNGGGHLNHSLYWQVMGPEKEVDTALVKDIEMAFGSMEVFKKQITDNALNRFGSGWSWLVKDASGVLKAYSTPNQDSPYLNNDVPIFGIDVWEHAYYLKYQNRRPEYVENWWHALKLI